ncbi:MAG: hypothetical protein IT198_03125 [Acidimicrobiia bacterium]|nr:hypothetical protein [Acidimicrobiia bacterium]
MINPTLSAHAGGHHGPDLADPVVPSSRVPLVGASWPVVAVCVGVPLGFFVGLQAVIWILPAVLFLPLLNRRELRIPASAIPLLLLLGWMLVSMLTMTGPMKWPLTMYRWLMFASALAMWLWILNTAEETLPTRRIVDMLAVLWVALIIFGYLAMAFPALSAPSLTQQVLPGSLGTEPFIRDLTTFRFAETQVLSETVVSRPSAPLPYTNGWGSTMALLTPFFIASFFVGRSRRRQYLGVVFGLLAIAPIVVSANRGLWLSLFIGATYLAIRRTLVGDWRALAVLIVSLAVIFSVITLTGMTSVISSKLDDSEDSNEQRSGLYSAALDATMDSPLLGFGATQSGEYQNPVGTHGLLWYVMFVHGFPAVTFLVLWVLAMLVTTARARTPTGLLAHTAILIFLFQLPIYGMLPQVVLMGIIAGIAWRELPSSPPVPTLDEQNTERQTTRSLP